MTYAALVLHVTNGDCTVEIMRRAHVVGDIVAWRDVLHEGPVPALGPAELRPVRARVPRRDGPGHRGDGRGRPARPRRAAGRGGRGGRARRAVVRARPLRPAPAAADPRRAARPPGRASS